MICCCLSAAVLTAWGTPASSQGAARAPSVPGGTPAGQPSTHGSAPSGQSSPSRSGNSGEQAVLSNMRTLSRWAYPKAPAAAYTSPSTQSRIVGRLHFLTEEGQAEIYMALRSYKKGRESWIDVMLPGRPNGLTGWVPAHALGQLHVVHEYLRVSREAFHAWLFRDGRLIWSAPVGVGRPSLPTPAGHFYVREKLTAIDSPLYGPYAFGTSAYAPTLTEWPDGGVVGIHGTDEPWLIPGRPSHGCVRLRNEDVARLWRLMQIGTPVEIV